MLNISTPRYVVTGAAGFIGSRLLEALVLRHPAEHLLAVDHPLSPEKSRNLAVAPNVPFVDHREFRRALNAGEISPGVIFHMGACSSTTETNWDYLAENNVGYSQHLWEWCAANGRQLIYASSAATYGNGSQGFDDEMPITLLQPLNLYGKSKQDFDLWVEQQQLRVAAKPKQSVGLKFFNVFGPGEAHKGRMASMVFHGWHQMHREGRVRLFKSHKEGYEDGGQLRDFIYVGDVVDVMLSLAERPDISGLFNLGTGQAHSFRELIEHLFAAADRPPRIDYVPMPEDLRGKYQYFTEACMQKLQRAGLTYIPTPLAAAVTSYVKWLRAPRVPASS